MSYKCNKCNKFFNYKSQYNIHINKKYPCKRISTDTPICSNLAHVAPTCANMRQNSVVISENPTKNKNQCTYCLKTFTRSNGLVRHLNGRCKNKKDQLQKESSEIDKLKEQLKEMDQLKEQLKEHKLMIEELKTQSNLISSNTTTNNKIQNNTINITNNNTINNNIIVAFGKEDLNKIISDNNCELLFRRGISAISELIKEVHCNEAHPEYANICVSNMRDNKAKCFNGNNWICMDLDECLSIIIDNKQLFLENKFEELLSKLSDRAITQFRRFIKQKNDPILPLRYKKQAKEDLYNFNFLSKKNQKIHKNNKKLIEQ